MKTGFDFSWTGRDSQRVVVKYLFLNRSYLITEDCYDINKYDEQVSKINLKIMRSYFIKNFNYIISHPVFRDFKKFEKDIFKKVNLYDLYEKDDLYRKPICLK